MKASSKGFLSLLLVIVLSVFTIGLWCALAPEPALAPPAVYNVFLTTDTPGAPFPGMPGELRWAINSANANAVFYDTIIFSIPAPPLTPVTITPTAPLPAITDPVLIDGYTQPTSLPPAAPGTAVILVELDGSLAGMSNGLTFNPGSAGSQVRGLAINRWNGDGIEIDGVAGVVVDGNYIGTDWTGALPLPNSTGVEIASRLGPANGNVIGGSTPANQNVISGNLGFGVVIDNSAGNFVQGNLIGTNAAGITPVPNGAAGILLYNAASANTIGGATPV